MRKKVDILTGNISTNLFKLALPIVLTSLISILYNLTDIKFISAYIGDSAVAAAAAATFFLVLGFAFLLVPKNGAQILVAQSIGAKLYRNARAYARISIIITIIFSVFCMTIGLVFSDGLIRLVGISNTTILNLAKTFLRYCCLGLPFLFLSNTISAIISADGDTFGPFVFNSLGVVINIFLDYFFLAFLNLGIKGAAIATVMSQIISFILLTIYFLSPKSKFRKMKLFKLDSLNMYIKLFKIGLPGGISQALFTIIAIVLANIIARYDEEVLAVQRLGVQFESFSWNISGGFSSAVATYIAQNYGAKQYDRIKKVYYISLKGISIFSVFISFVFIVFAEPLYRAFLHDERLIHHGINYLTIVGLAQALQCVEIITNGAFNGIGRINEPTIIGVVGTASRIPLAYFLAPIFGITAIWWVICGTMVVKGIVSFILFIFLWNRFLLSKEKKKYENSNR